MNKANMGRFDLKSGQKAAKPGAQGVGDKLQPEAKAFVWKSQGC